MDPSSYLLLRADVARMPFATGSGAGAAAVQRAAPALLVTLPLASWPGCESVQAGVGVLLTNQLLSDLCEMCEAAAGWRQ